jgi:hypothetical protein
MRIAERKIAIFNILNLRKGFKVAFLVTAHMPLRMKVQRAIILRMMLILKSPSGRLN